MSPFDSESRMAAQLAPLLTVELMPYFLNNPFSCAITIGEQSVRAIIPNFRSGVSGPSSAAQLALALRSPALPINAAAPPTNSRRETPVRWGFDSIVKEETGLVGVRFMPLLWPTPRFQRFSALPHRSKSFFLQSTQDDDRLVADQRPARNMTLTVGP